jgi:uncharacterized protein (DUF58 family)
MAPGRPTLTPPAWYLVGTLLVIALLGALSGIKELYAVGAAGLAVMVTSQWLLSWRRGLVAVQRAELLPPQGAVGSTAVAKLVLTNVGGRRSPPCTLNLALDQVGPIYGGAPTLAGDWLYADHGDPATIRAHSLNFHVPVLEPGEDVVASFVLPTARRGVWRLGLVTATIGDPLGLFEKSWSRELGLYFVVHPEVRPSGRLLQMLAAEPSVSSSLAVPVPRAGDDLRSVREFQEGDDFRLVHWRATARWGRLMVRQEQAARGQLVVVAIDLRAGSHTPASLERALETAASLLCAVLAEGDARARLVTTRGGQLGPGSGDVFRAHILAFLAMAEPHEGPPKPVQGETRPQLTIIITSTSSAARELVPDGEGRYLGSTVVVLTEETAPSPVPAPAQSR